MFFFFVVVVVVVVFCQHVRLECCKPSCTVAKKNKLTRSDRSFQVLSKEVPGQTGQSSASELMLSGSNGNRTFPALFTDSKTERCKAKRVSQFHPRTHERERRTF